jgi:hypothetical protein
MPSHITTCGIPGVGMVPYGLHMCHFYPSRADLIDALVPYFLAAVEHNERGLWIASAPLPAAEITSEIVQWPELKDAIRAGQLRVIDAVEWYGDPATLNSGEIVERLAEEEARALADGYQGLRITSNRSSLWRGDWDRLMDYEKRLHEGLRGRRIVACCSYHDESRAVDMLEIVRRHHAALDFDDRHWHVWSQKAHEGLIERP